MVVTITENLHCQVDIPRGRPLYTAIALTRLERLEEAKALLTEELVVNDLKEGEYSISQLWVELYRLVIAREKGITPEEITEFAVLEQYPLPYQLDFRMH